MYSNTYIKIDVPTRQLHFFRAGHLTHNYPIAVGKPTTPTPPGTYSIIEKIVNPGGVLGTRWLGLDIPNGPYGIHGTWNPSSIGNAVSNGCIRLFNKDIEELFGNVRIGTTVFIHNPALP